MIKKLLLVKSPTTKWESHHMSLSSNISEEVPEPLGLCYLAAVLREKGFEVEIFDPHLEVYDAYRHHRDPELIKDCIRKRFAQQDFDMIGVSSMFIYCYKWAHFCCEAAKEANADIPVVIGGGHPSVVMEETLNDKNIDYLVVGEAEVSFINLINALNAEDPMSELAQIGGVMYRMGDEVIHNPRRDYIWELDEIPFPAWDLIDLKRYMATFAEGSSQRKHTVMMITSRGCPFDCTFCNVFQSWGKKFRKRSAENILEEIDWLVNEFGIEEIMFVDDNMTIDKRRMLALCDGLKERDVTWRVVNVASFVTNEHMLREMKAAGCTKVSISVESGSPQILKDMKKPVDLDWSESVVNICREEKMPVTVNFILGMPYETKDHMLETIDWAAKVQPDWSTFSILVPYPGTEIFEYSRKQGYLDPDSLNLEGLSQRNPTIQTETWTREWVAEHSYRANITINFLDNYNLHNEDGNLPYVTGFMENIVMHHPRHVIALVSLAYAYMKAEKPQEKIDELLTRAHALSREPDVRETYGEYLDMDHPVINHFNTWVEERKQDLVAVA